MGGGRGLQQRGVCSMGEKPGGGRLLEGCSRHVVHTTKQHGVLKQTMCKRECSLRYILWALSKLNGVYPADHCTLQLASMHDARHLNSVHLLEQ